MKERELKYSILVCGESNFRIIVWRGRYVKQKKLRLKQCRKSGKLEIQE